MFTGAFVAHEHRGTRVRSQEQATARPSSRPGRGHDPEVAVFAQGARVDGSADLPASFPAPTLVISYRVEPSGAAYATKKPRGIFLGLLFFFTTDFMVPGGEPLRTKLTSSQRVPVPMLKDAATARPGTLEAQIYEAMSKEAFAEIRDHYLAAWTKKGEAPSSRGRVASGGSTRVGRRDNRPATSAAESTRQATSHFMGALGAFTPVGPKDAAHDRPACVSSAPRLARCTAAARAESAHQRRRDGAASARRVDSGA